MAFSTAQPKRIVPITDIIGTTIRVTRCRNQKLVPTVFSTAQPRLPAKVKITSGTTTPATRSHSPYRRARMEHSIAKTNRNVQIRGIIGTTILATRNRSRLQHARTVFNIARPRMNAKGGAITGTQIAVISSLKLNQRHSLNRNKSRTIHHRPQLSRLPNQIIAILYRQRRSLLAITALRQTSLQKLLIPRSHLLIQAVLNQCL